MVVDTRNLVSISEAIKDFGKIARMVDEKGTLVILENNEPKYVLMDYGDFERGSRMEGQNLEKIADQILTKYKKAFEELAK